MNRVVAFAVAGALIGACSSFGTTAEPLATFDGGTDAAVSDVVVAVDVVDGGSEGGTVVPDAGCGANDAACEIRCGADLCGSCKAIQGALPSAGSGFYAIESKGGAKVDVYCDMTTAGGGWTLAARSHSNPPADAANNFGWRSSFGDVMDDSKPYSLDVVGTLAMLPTEVLFGRRNEHFDWGAQVYRNALPTGFFTDGQTQAFLVFSTLKNEIGSCTGGSFQKYIGWVKHTGFFFMRDNDRDDGAYGLFPDGWEVNNQTQCSTGGNLNPGSGRSNGMLMVR